MPNPWNGKVVLETFWWNCWMRLPSRLVHLAGEARSAHCSPALGFDGIWIPPPCKDTNAEANMGYTPYDYYYLGQKDRKGAIWTGYGTMDSLLRLAAVAHANGLEVYPDIVLDHCAGGDPNPSSPLQSSRSHLAS